MASPLQCTNVSVNYRFDEEPTLKVILQTDSEEGIRLFKVWCGTHPHYDLMHGDRLGENMLVHAMSWGNVSLVKYIVATNPITVNMLTNMGTLLFTAATMNISLSVIRPPVHKVAACASIIIQGGYDVNLCNTNVPSVQINFLKRTVNYVKEQGNKFNFDVSEGSYLKPIIKLMIQAGANYQTGFMGPMKKVNMFKTP